MPKINPRIKSIDDLLGLDAAEESPIEPIITYLGMGIVWFTDPPAQPEPTDYDYEYRVDTDVITPVP